MNRYLLTFMVNSASKGKVCMQEVWISNSRASAAMGFNALKNKWAGFIPVSITEL